MAVFTPLSLDDAEQLLREHGLQAPDRIRPIAAGSVNSNYFVDTNDTTYFIRIYEEQGVEGVAYEWRLLDRLQQAGAAVAARCKGTTPGQCLVFGKPTAVFERVLGDMICQAGVNVGHVQEVGRALAKVHLACADFRPVREGRFTRAQILARRDGLGGLPELQEALETIDRAAAATKRLDLRALPSGVIHGDLFRDNVLWEGPRLSALLDWESASHGAWAFDLAVVFLAWTYGDAFDWTLARALLTGYQDVRALTEHERQAFQQVALAAAMRFSVTRITDFHLRRGESDADGDTGAKEAVFKDYQRFIDRLRALLELRPETFTERLF